jgi:hypothetical protein
MQSKQQTLPTLTVYPRRWALLITLLLSLIVLALVGNVFLSLFQKPYGLGITILFGLLLLICLVYVSGFIWSALSLLITRHPSLQADADGLTLRHLPFLPKLELPWTEIKSVHTYRYLFLGYLCIVPHEVGQLLTHANLWSFALNASTRFSLRTSAPLNVSQGLFDRSVLDVVLELHKTYGVERTEDKSEPDGEQAKEQTKE